MKQVSISLLLIALVVGCTKKSDTSGGGGGSESGGISLAISSVGETMQFDKTELNVKAGDKVTLTMKNPSTTLKHNWVLTKPGKDNEVGLAGIAAGEVKGFIPDSPEIIAHTKLIPPGSEDSVTFTAPPAGDYPYICTNVGHHTIMKGILHSK